MALTKDIEARKSNIEAPEVIRLAVTNNVAMPESQALLRTVRIWSNIWPTGSDTSSRE